jgi:signal peptidase II
VVSNRGVSFSWLSGSSLVLVGALSVAVLAVMVLIGFYVSSGAPSVAWGLIVGGAVGNVADRLGLATHHVVDFIGYGNLFVGNVADIAIALGVSVLSVRVLRRQTVMR